MRSRSAKSFDFVYDLSICGRPLFTQVELVKFDKRPAAFKAAAPICEHSTVIFSFSGMSPAVAGCARVSISIYLVSRQLKGKTKGCNGERKGAMFPSEPSTWCLPLSKHQLLSRLEDGWRVRSLELNFKFSRLLLILPRKAGRAINTPSH